MNIGLIRFVDKWPGSIICFFLDVFNRIFPDRTTAKPPYRKILFIELSEMGSIILAYPAFKEILDSYDHPEFHMLTFKKNKPAAEMLGIFKHIHTIDDSSLPKFVSDCLRTIFKLPREHFDVVFEMELFSRFASILTYLSGKIRVGFYAYDMEGLYMGNLLTHRVIYNPHIHMKDNFLSLVDALQLDTNDPPLSKKHIREISRELPVWRIDEAKCMVLKQKLYHKSRTIFDAGSKLVLVKASGGILPIRAWPAHRYKELITRLLCHSEIHILLIGTGDECMVNDDIKGSIQNDRCINLTNATSLDDVLNLMHISHLLISNDGGPAHFASMTGIRTMVFYGPETPALYGPLGNNCTVLYSRYSCSPCLSAYNHRKSSCKNNLCLQSIDAGYVYDMALKILFGSRTSAV